MSKEFAGSDRELAGRSKHGDLTAVGSSFGKLLHSFDGNPALKQPKSVREDNADDAAGIRALVLGWLMEDLGITASVCRVDSIAVFRDLLAMIASQTPRLPKAETHYAEAVDDLLEWFLEDIGSVARSFNFDPVDMFEEVAKEIISHTPPAERARKAAVPSGRAVENRRP